MDNKEQYINEIANHLLKHNVALFIGAGFSMQFGYPSWSQLLNEIIDENNLRSEIKESKIFSYVSGDEIGNKDEINKFILDNLLGVDYLRGAGYIDFLLRNKKETSMHKEVIDIINTYENKRLSNEDTKGIIKFISKYKEYLLDIITTNYDTNIEYCMDNEISVISRDLSTINNIRGKNKLYKIHGCINDEDMEGKIFEDKRDTRIVITERDYHNFKARNRYLFYRTYSIFTEKKIVFLGYSINDPNIRGLLNDVIEEGNGKIDFQMYWINRDKLSNIDKSYYTKEYNLKIIDELDLVNFFVQLDGRIEKNKELRNINKEDILEYANEFIKKYCDSIMIQDIIKEDKAEDILKYLYLDIVENENDRAIEPFFMLIIECDSKIKKSLRLSTQTILELIKNKYSLLLGKMEYNNKLVDFIIDEGFKVTHIKTIINCCSGDQVFGGYATSIGMLLKTYKIYGEISRELKEDYINALFYNIRISCKMRVSGYDYHGVEEVEENIHILSVEYLNLLLDKYKKRDKDGPYREQINAIINYSVLSELDKKMYMYKYIYMYDFKDKINEFIYDLLEKCFEEDEDYKWNKGGYLNSLKNIKITYEDEEVENKIQFNILEEISGNIILKLYQEYIEDNNSVKVSVDDIDFKIYNVDLGWKEIRKCIEEDFYRVSEKIFKERFDLLIDVK